MNNRECLEILKDKLLPCFEAVLWKGQKEHPEKTIQIQALSHVITLLQTLIDIEKGGFPKDKKIAGDKDMCLASPDEDYDIGYNQALSECKLYLTSRCDEEKMMKIIEDMAVDCNSQNITPSFIWKCSLKDLAHALHNWLIGKEDKLK